MRTIQAVSIAVLLGVHTLSAPSRADPPGPPAKLVAQAMTEKARQLFADGVKAYLQSRWADARASFLAAWSLSQHYTIAGNLADCELKLGMYRDAAQHFAIYVRELAKDASTTPAERKDGEDHYAQARAKVGQADVRVSLPGAEVYVDGKLLGSAPLPDPVFLDPGRHVIEARGDGYPPARAGVEARPGAAQAVTLTLARAPDPAPERRSVVPGAVLGGVAGAALVSGIAVVAVGAKKHASNTALNQAIAQAHHSCVAGAANFDPQCSTLKDSASAADTLGRAGVGLLVGAGAAAVGSVIYFVWPESKPRAPASGGVRVVPVVSTSSGGVIVSGAF